MYNSMTTAEACKKFNLTKSELDKRRKAGMIYPRPSKGEDGRYIISDETEIIPSQMDIVTFLLQILKYKNNPNIVISRQLCPGDQELKAVLNYLYHRGFIGEYTYSPDIAEAFDTVSLTDGGFAYILGGAREKQISAAAIVPITLNVNLALAHC